MGALSAMAPEVDATMPVTARARKRWTPEEEREIVALAGRLGLDEIARRLGRSPIGIRSRRGRLGLGAIAGPRSPAERGLTLTEVARILGVGRKAVRPLLKAGMLVGHQSADRIGNGPIWRVMRADLADFLHRHPDRYDAATITDPAWRALAVVARPPTLDGEALLRVAEVARRLCLGEAGVRQAIRRGDLQAVLQRDANPPHWLVLAGAVRDYRPPSISGRTGIDAATTARRVQILVERPALQARYEAGTEHQERRR